MYGNKWNLKISFLGNISALPLLILCFDFFIPRCRSVVVDADGRPMVFDVDITDPTGQIVPEGNPWPLGIVSVIWE